MTGARAEGVAASRGAVRREEPDLAVEACRGLIGLGWKAAVARPAVEAARVVVGEDAPLEALIFEALRRCRRSRGDA